VNSYFGTLAFSLCAPLGIGLMAFGCAANRRGWRLDRPTWILIGLLVALMYPLFGLPVLEQDYRLVTVAPQGPHVEPPLRWWNGLRGEEK